jgi:DNA processing protein
MAHGLDTIYPKENSGLAESILENGGALLSEYPIGTKGDKSNFVARNRIISGMSNGVIVFEADEKSGTMHTARYAYTQGRKIFCPNLSDESGTLSSGVQKLLSTGSAIPIRNAGDVLNHAFGNEKYTIQIDLGFSVYKKIEYISKIQCKSVDELIGSIILDYIEGGKGHE